MISVFTHRPFRGRRADRVSFSRRAGAAALMLVGAVTAGCTGTTEAAGHVTKQTGPTVSQTIKLPVNAGPAAMTTASDGSLWIAEGSIGAIAKVSPAGHISQFRIPGSSNDPDGILQEASDQIVFVGFEELGYVTPGRPITGYEDGEGINPGLPVAITVGPDGMIWYTNSAEPPQITRIVGSQGPVAVATLPDSNVYFQPGGLATGPDNAVWFTEGTSKQYGNDGIGRVSETGAYTSWTLPPATDPHSITEGPDDAMWFTDRTGIGKITTAGSITSFPVLRGVRPTDIIAGNDGALWFTTATRVGRITTAGKVTTWPVTGAKNLAAISPGPDGSFWIADEASSVIRRFTPPAQLRRSLAELPCTPGALLKALTRDNQGLDGWTPQRYACANGWAVAAGNSKGLGVGIALLHATEAGWQSTGLNDGSCMAATPGGQCPYPPTTGVPSHMLLVSLVHKAGLAITANGSVVLPSSASSHSSASSDTGLPCKPALLFAAAEAKQHFSTDRSKYPPEAGQGPGAYDPVCYDRWAIALVSHPEVGTTDGEVVFRAENGKWVYFAQAGGVPSDCILQQLGLPADVAKHLWPPAHTADTSYCNQSG